MIKNCIKMLLFLFTALTFSLALYGCSGSDCDGGGASGGTSPVAPIINQGRIAGTVTGNGAPIVDATVTLTGIKTTVNTNGNGAYSFTNLAAGNYSVTVSAPNFVSQTKSVTLASNTDQKIADFELIQENQPQLFSNLYGGTYDDFANEMESYYAKAITQPDGTFWMCGFASSTDGDLTSSPAKGNKDGWVLHVDPSKPDGQQILYSRTIGGNADDAFTDMKMTADGTLWLCGLTDSVDSGDLASAIVKGHGDYDGWLVHLDPASNQILYNRCIGGNAKDFFWHMELSGDTVWLCGETFSAYGDNEGNNHHGNRLQDAWLVQVNPNPNLPVANQITYNVCYGGSQGDSFINFKIMLDNTIWALGGTASNDGDLANSVVNLHGELGLRDTWLAHIDTTKSVGQQVIYSRCFGGTRQEVGYSMIYNSDNTIWISATTDSTDGDLLGAGPNGISDLWLIKVNPALDVEQQIVYSRCFGGSKEEGLGANYMLQDTDNSLWIATDTASTDGDIAHASVGNHGGTDMWILHIDANGNILSSVCKGGTGDEYSPALALSGNFLWAVCSSTSSNSGDVTATNHGGYDAWLFNMLK